MSHRSSFRRRPESSGDDAELSRRLLDVKSGDNPLWPKLDSGLRRNDEQYSEMASDAPEGRLISPS
jgi:hypothetical protein